MSNKADPRVIRTRRLLRNALLKLIAEHGYNAVTVSDIADEATLNRSTFYMHYTDKDDLFQHVIAENLAELRAIQPMAHDTPDMAAIRRIYVQLFEHVQTHHDFYVLMLGNRSVAVFARQMEQHIRQIVLDMMEPYPAKAGQIHTGLYASFVSSAFLGVTKWWLLNNDEMPPETIARQFMQLTLGGMVNEFDVNPADLFSADT